MTKRPDLSMAIVTQSARELGDLVDMYRRNGDAALFTELDRDEWDADRACCALSLAVMLLATPATVSARDRTGESGTIERDNAEEHYNAQRTDE